ncbi:hypothetical protein, partial [Candidatus Symbiothrix dinenymphae]|uniref:hypothetical protein n=1 Tax=Candidatus Symbiothrix dinenymphae TaxID=467085 RepID=UPI000A8C2CA6
MTKFKNVFLLAAMAVSAGFVGCNKEEDEENGVGVDGSIKADGSLEITASNVSTGAVEVDSVKVVVWSNEDQKEYIIASAPYKDGGFTLN